MDELVFAEREADIDLVPVGAADFRLQQEPVAFKALLERSVGLGLTSSTTFLSRLTRTCLSRDLETNRLHLGRTPCTR